MMRIFDLEVWFDYVVDDGEERLVGFWFKRENASVWIFHEPVHGYYLAYGDQGLPENQRWINSEFR